MKLVESKKISIFPLSIIHCRFNDFKKSELIDFALDLKNNIPSVQLTNRNGWHSPNLTKLIVSDEHQQLISYITDIILQGAGNMFPDNYKSVITKLWINVNPNNAENIIHHHDNQGYSGCFYIKKRKDGSDGNIEFKDTRYNSKVWTIKENRPKSEEVYNYMTFKAEEGDLIIFPSYLEHKVNLNKTNDIRISVSFNLNLEIKND